ncbi:MAG: hypothetical protein WBS54_16215 [Acidobacteriota bacterium]
MDQPPKVRLTGTGLVAFLLGVTLDWVRQDPVAGDQGREPFDVLLPLALWRRLCE